jgi:hypothetical protein
MAKSGTTACRARRLVDVDIASCEQTICKMLLEIVNEFLIIDSLSTVQVLR